MENEQEYQKEYNQFITDYNSEQMDGEKIGIAVVKMVQHFIEMNMLVASTEINYKKIAAENVTQLDEKGKIISVAKSEILTQATEEYRQFRTAKAHCINIEQAINALKSLQKGVTSEMSYSGIT